MTYEHPLDQLWIQVANFHLAFDHPVGDAPKLQNSRRVEARADWITEEAEELRDARTIVEQADAYIDALYFAIGGLVELGVKPGALFDIVHSANMAKIQPDGSVKRRVDGKIIKPEGWTPPDAAMAAEIERQIDAGAA